MSLEHNLQLLQAYPAFTNLSEAYFLTYGHDASLIHQYRREELNSPFKTAFENWMNALEKELSSNEDEAIIKNKADKTALLTAFQLAKEKSAKDSFELVCGRKIRIDYCSNDTQLEQEGMKDWTKEVNKAPFQFFKTVRDLTELNSAARLATVNVRGVLNGFRKVEMPSIQPIDWAKVEELIYDEYAVYEQYISAELLNEGKNAQKIESCYFANEFELCIELEGEFNEEEVEALRSTEFSCFPFYIPSQINHFKWIEQTKDGNLLIKLQSKSQQPYLIGCELSKHMAS